MAAFTGYANGMARLLPPDIWYIASTLISPTGFGFEEVVADAMTVKAVPRCAEPLLELKGTLP